MCISIVTTATHPTFCGVPHRGPADSTVCAAAPAGLRTKRTVTLLLRFSAPDDDVKKSVPFFPFVCMGGCTALNSPFTLPPRGAALRPCPAPGSCARTQHRCCRGGTAPQPSRGSRSHTAGTPRRHRGSTARTAPRCTCQLADRRCGSSASSPGCIRHTHSACQRCT